MIDKEALLRVFEKLRDELVSLQSLRARLQTFKLTSIGALLIAATIDKVPLATEDKKVDPRLKLVALIIAPLLAVAIDASIEAMSVSIKQIGAYIRLHIEPLLFPTEPAPDGQPSEPFLAYELFLCRPTKRPRRLSWAGSKPNFAVTLVTLLACAVSGAVIANDPDKNLNKIWWSVLLFAFLAIAGAGLWWNFKTLRPPKSWTTVAGRTDEVVLVPGQYCGENPASHNFRISLFLRRGERFPPIDGKKVGWTLAILFQGASPPEPAQASDA